jgi:hypothetical protein
MNPAPQSIAYRATITKFYKKALYSYCLPFALLAIGFFSTPGLVALAVLLSIPAGITGMVFSTRGFRLAREHNDREKKDIGYANLLLGGALVGSGLLVTGFGYLWISG